MIKIGTFMFLLFANICTAQDLTHPFSLTKTEWKSDLDTLVHLIENNHVDPFWRNKSSDWINLKSEVHSYLQKNNRIENDKIAGYFTKMIAFISDGHSSYIDIQQVKPIPLKLKFYSDGLYVVGTPEEYKTLLGNKITEIEGKNITEVLNIIKPFVPSANQSAFYKFSPFALINANLLHGAGLSNGNDRINFKVTTKEGLEISKTVRSLNLNEYANLVYKEVRFIANKHNIKNYHSNENYSFEYLPSQKAIYLKFLSVRDKPSQRLKSFSDSLMAFCKITHPSKLIIDIRENDGGNNFLSAYLVERIAADNELNQTGKIFLITGHHTFSAAISFAIQMQKRTKALIVGSSPGDSPNFPADNETYILPKSKGMIKLSKQFWINSFAYDTRFELKPDINAEPNFLEALNGIDKALDTIFSYQMPASQKNSENKNLDKYLGNYFWGIDKKFELYKINGTYAMVSSDKFQTELRPVNGNPQLYEFRIKNLFFEAKNNQLSLVINGKKKPLKKIKNNDSVGLDEIYKGNLNLAEALYKKHSLSKNINTFELNGNNLCMSAAIVYYQTNSKEKCSKLLDISSQLDRSYKESGVLLNFIIK